MPIEHPLRCSLYESGGLVQQCDSCRWAQRGHKRELAECPECGAALGEKVALEFGGGGVLFNGKDFHVWDNTGASVVIERADSPEMIQFLCRHATDTRNGQIIHDTNGLRRVPWTAEFTQQLRLWRKR